MVLICRGAFTQTVLGVRKSFSFILSSLLLLLTWVLYFRSCLDDKGVFEFGKWSCFSVVICSLLWLIKSFVILSWEARVVYDRLSTEILEAGEVLYFLGVVGRSKFDIFGLLYEDGRSRESEEESVDTRKPHLVRLYIASVLGLVSVDKHRSRLDQEEESNGCRKVMKMSARKRKMVRDELLMLQHMGIKLCMQQVARYILAAKDTLSKEKFISSILSQFRKDEDNREILKKIIDWKSNSNIEEDSNGSSTNSEKDDKDSRLDDWEYFEKLLKDIHPSEELSFLKIEA